MNARNQKNPEGLTLIEVIVVIMVIAVVVTILFTSFWGTPILKSHWPRENLVRSRDLQQVMANIVADYKPYPVWKPSQRYEVNDKIMPTVFSRSGQRWWYKCTQAGTSGATEPYPWTNLAMLIDDGGVKWQYQSTPPLLTLKALKDKIGVEDEANKKTEYDKSTNQYGYYVIENRWIDFDSSTKTEISSNDQNILKVTIGNDIRTWLKGDIEKGERISALFF
jgi:prepilin-type N-terminal cleavage/methylation domain-containing protein